MQTACAGPDSDGSQPLVPRCSHAGPDCGHAGGRWSCASDCGDDQTPTLSDTEQQFVGFVGQDLLGSDESLCVSVTPSPPPPRTSARHFPPHSCRLLGLLFSLSGNILCRWSRQCVNPSGSAAGCDTNTNTRTCDQRPNDDVRTAASPPFSSLFCCWL